MKKRLVYLAGAIICAAGIAFVTGAEDTERQSPFHGMWRWDFTMPDGSKVSPRLRIKDEDGKLTGTARFRPGAETAITNLTVKGNELSFAVMRERDGAQVITRYSGKVSGDKIKGKITSNWAGDEQTYDWEAMRANSADGTWRWSSSFGEFRFDSTATLKEEGEKITGKIPSRRGGGDTEIKNGKFKDGKISFETERERDGEKIVTKYSGKLSGDKITGTIRSTFGGSPRTNEWDAVRID